VADFVEELVATEPSLVNSSLNPPDVTLDLPSVRATSLPMAVSVAVGVTAVTLAAAPMLLRLTSRFAAAVAR